MKKPVDMKYLEQVFGVLDLGEMTEALDAVLFTACLSYLDVQKHGAPSEEDADNVYLVRVLLETLRASMK